MMFESWCLKVLGYREPVFIPHTPQTRHHAFFAYTTGNIPPGNSNVFTRTFQFSWTNTGLTQSHFRHFSALSYLLKTKAYFLKWKILSLSASKGTPTYLVINTARSWWFGCLSDLGLISEAQRQKCVKVWPAWWVTFKALWRNEHWWITNKC